MLQIVGKSQATPTNPSLALLDANYIKTTPIANPLLLIIVATILVVCVCVE